MVEPGKEVISLSAVSVLLHAAAGRGKLLSQDMLPGSQLVSPLYKNIVCNLDSKGCSIQLKGEEIKEVKCFRPLRDSQ